jgi:hypothetical protein
MIDAVGCSSAVTADVIIASKHSPSRHRGAALIRNFHHVSQTNNNWRLNRKTFGVNSSAVISHDLCFIEQDKTNGATRGDDTERFVRCIEYERAPHHYLARNREKEGDRRAMNISEPDSILCTTRDNRAHQWCELLHPSNRVRRHIG